MESSVVISQTATCGPDGFSSPKSAEAFGRPSEEDPKDTNSKPPFLHYGDVPLIELRRACILLASSVCSRMRYAWNIAPPFPFTLSPACQLPKAL
jgi:hypothetical protein